MTTPEDRPEEFDEAIREEEMIKLRRLADNRPEIILFILEELMDQIQLSEEEKGRVIRDGIAKWTEAGRE